MSVCKGGGGGLKDEKRAKKKRLHEQRKRITSSSGSKIGKTNSYTNSRFYFLQQKCF